MIFELLKVFLLAMTPVGELRVAIPVGLAVFRLDWWLVYLISVLGNLVPVVFLLLFLEPISQYLSSKFKISQKFFNWIFARTRKRYVAKKMKWGYLGLIPLVAVPLPLTGGWTGSIIAFLFGIPFWIAFLLIAIGVGIAGIIVSLATFFGIALSRYFCWQIALGIGLVIGLIIWLGYNRGKGKLKGEN